MRSRQDLPGRSNRNPCASSSGEPKTRLASADEQYPLEAALDPATPLCAALRGG
jgi:hypothetical protein